MGQRNRSLVLTKGKNSLFLQKVLTGFGLIQSGWIETADHFFHLVPRLRMIGALPPRHGIHLESFTRAHGVPLAHKDTSIRLVSALHGACTERAALRSECVTQGTWPEKGEGEGRTYLTSHQRPTDTILPQVRGWTLLGEDKTLYVT